MQMKQTFLFLTALCFLAYTNKAMAQSWSLNNGTLTVNDNTAFSTTPYPWVNNVNAVTKLVIGSGVTTVPNGVFNGCINLKTVTIADGTVTLVLSGSSGHFTNSPIETLYLGRDLDTGFYNDPNPFAENTSLKSVTVGNGVAAINGSSFYNCTGLQSLTMGSSLVSIGSSAFYGCSSLTGALFIPQGVKTIGDAAFQGCRALPSVTVPNSVNSIGNQAFNGCINLKTVTIADGTVTLVLSGSSGHFTNSPIETLYLGRDLVTGFYNDPNPFAENTSLKSVTIGQDVTTINSQSFYNCTGLSTVTSKNPNPPTTTNNNCFYDVYKTCKLYVPIGFLSKYNNANQPEWKKFYDNSNMIEGSPTGIEDIVANQLKIYPNPNKSNIYIKSELPIKKVEIYSLTGALLLFDNNFSEKISVSSLLKGTYLVKVYTDNGITVSKIVKE